MASIGIPFSRHRRFQFGSLPHWVILAFVLALVVYPIVLVLLNSFQTAHPGQAASFSLEAWQSALSNESLLTAFWNTIQVVAVRQAIAMPVAILLAWVIARTDIPGSNWLEFLFWVGWFLPALPVTLGWILLLDPQFGLLNQLLAMIPGVGEGALDIYSFWGIIWAHLGGATISVKVMLLTPAFRNMDASLEEASRVSGASTIGTLARIVVPIMTPALAVTFLLSVIVALQAFEVEMVLGMPIGFYVFSTQIYWLIVNEPPMFQGATALSSIILGMMIPLIVIQRWAVGRRRFTTVTGHFKSQKLRLRKWKLPAFFAVLGVVGAITVLPFVFLLLGTFMKLFGFFNIADPWTTEHWSKVVDDPIFLTSVGNTLIIASATAIASIVLFVLIAYVVVRTHFAGRAMLDFTSWLPATLPGIILSLGLVWLFVGNPILRPLYGSLVLLVIATVISTMSLGVQIVKSTFAQLGLELEEAARVVGSSWVHAFRHILMPIIAPTLLLVGTVSFISAAKNVSTVALIATSATRPLSLLQMDFMVDGRYESAAVVGVIVVLLTTGVALVARVLGLRVGIAH